MRQGGSRHGQNQFAVAPTTLEGYGITDAASISHTHAQSDITGLTADLASKEATANKGASSGYCGLDSGAKVAIGNIPTGSTSSTVCIGNDARLSDSRDPSGSASGDLTGTYPGPSIANGAVTEVKQTLADNTTNDVSSTKHGYAPKSPADAARFLNGAATPAFAAVKDSDLSTSDIATNDVSTSKHGFVPKAPNDGTKFLDGTGAWDYAEDWDFVSKIVTSDFVVTNGTLQDVTGFSAAVVSGNTYEVEVVGASAASNTTGDIAIALACTGTWGTGQGWTEGIAYSSAGALASTAATAFASTTLSTASPGLTINNGDAVVRPFRMRYLFTCTGNGNAKLQMGQAAAAGGRTSTLKIGTTFRLRRIG